RRTQKEPFLHLLRSLRGDPDVVVRAHVAGLLREVEALPPRTVQEREPTTPPAPPTTPPPHGKLGRLALEGEAQVRVKLDRGAEQTRLLSPIELPSGRHTLRYVGGKQELRVRSGQVLRVRVPVTLVEQLLHDADEAIGDRDLKRCQELLDRVRRLLQRGNKNP